jgi:uncharacterized protein YhaN
LLASLDAKLEQATRIETESRNAEIALTTTEIELQRNLRRAGVNETDLQSAMSIFEGRCEQAIIAKQLQVEIENQARELRAVLGNQSLDQLVRRREELSIKIDAIRAVHEEWLELTPVDPELDLQSQIESARSEIADIRSDLAGIEERLSSGLHGLRLLVDVDEEIDAVEQTISSLALHGEALQLAQQQLEAAAEEYHRNFLPRLNRIVGRNISQITGGRYEQLQIDHANFQVSLYLPNSLYPIKPDVLSRGAQEQIYLMLRLGLTELMSSGRERLPLILDDPLVNYDQDRLQHGLDFLAGIAESGQVLLFTKDAEIARWFEARHELSNNHKLHIL